MIEYQTLRKIRRVRGSIATQAHLDRILRSLPQMTQDEALAHFQPHLKPGLTVIRTEAELAQVKPSDPQNPTIHESTAMRLNLQSQQIGDLSKQIGEKDKEIATLRAQVAELQAESRTERTK